MSSQLLAERPHPPAAYFPESLATQLPILCDRQRRGLLRCSLRDASGRSLTAAPCPVSQATPFQEQGLLLWLASCQQRPAGSQMSLSCENQESPERSSLNGDFPKLGAPPLVLTTLQTCRARSAASAAAPSAAPHMCHWPGLRTQLTLSVLSLLQKADAI